MRSRCLGYRTFSLLVALTLTGSWASFAEGLRPVSLQTEWLLNPSGIDSLAPRLSWKLESPLRAQRQIGYRLLVATSKQLLEGNAGDLWDSGKVASKPSNSGSASLCRPMHAAT